MQVDDALTPFQHPLATYSIVACDLQAKEVGVAVQSHYFSVGSIAPSAIAGIGAAVIQSIPKLEYSYGTLGLKRLREGVSPPEALAELIRDDWHHGYRQVAIVNCQADIAVFTGKKCVGWAGHVRGEDFSCQANMVSNDQVWHAMATAFRTAKGDLAMRMLTALKGGENQGGDLRGKQSASLIVVSHEPSDNPIISRLFDLRVEDHPRPLTELTRLVKLQRAYRFNAQGIAALAKGDDQVALAAFQESEKLVADRCQLKFWRAVALNNAGYHSEAEALFHHVFSKEPHWKPLIPKLRRAQLLEGDAPDAEDAKE